jgi:hypothetical protein
LIEGVEIGGEVLRGLLKVAILITDPDLHSSIMCAVGARFEILASILRRPVDNAGVMPPACW